MPQMIWRAVGAGSWTWASPQWRRYTGQLLDESNGDNWLMVVHPEDQDAARSSWRKAHAVGQFHADLRIRAQDGSYKWFQTRAKPVRNDAGEIVE
jgi:PAS domain S-box-containing protein